MRSRLRLKDAPMKLFIPILITLSTLLLCMEAQADDACYQVGIGPKTCWQEVSCQANDGTPDFNVVLRDEEGRIVGYEMCVVHTECAFADYKTVCPHGAKAAQNAFEKKKAAILQAIRDNQKTK